MLKIYDAINHAIEKILSAYLTLVITKMTLRDNVSI